MSQSQFYIDIKNIREEAKKNLDNGAVTDGYNVDKTKVINMLNAALATELICHLRYKQHYYMCEGMSAEVVAAEFLEHANEEMSHADNLAARIAQLGGEPEMDPVKISKTAHSEYKPAETIEEMLRENLIAERVAIDSYRAMIGHLGDADPTTRRMLEDILAVEEEHADDLSGLLQKPH